MAFTNIIDIIYPIGSLYFTSSTTSPATLFGGTWTCVQDKFYPETLVSKPSLSKQVNNERIICGDVLNGIAVVSGQSYGNETLVQNKYTPIATRTFALGTAIANSTKLAQKGVAGGFFTMSAGTDCGSGAVFTEPDNKSDDKILSIYTNKASINYWKTGATNTIDIPTRTLCYIWRRTA